MVRRRLGTTDLELSVLGFGAFKIGRNEGVKYAQGYDLPSDAAATQLVHDVLALGINYIDTAPAYGVSEQRVGTALADRTDVVVSTKTGECFEDGQSTYDFSEAGTLASIGRSCERLGRDVLDMVFIHSDGDDLRIQHETDVVSTLCGLREDGAIRAIGFSGKTVEGAHNALVWADALMVEYHLEDRSHEDVIALAAERGVGVVVKKGLASGRLDPAAAIEFVLGNPGVTSLVVGGLSIEHLRANAAVAGQAGESG